ncbi:translation elongation factor Ts [Limibacter armeniacum]|uniref:translation elongation factor Ts n=1 Tax=Limibacter armeniacum TaxID=466084 RepID=UPI002FE69A79
MAISAQDVKKLRDMTGAGMMDCKKALAEAESDFDKAVEILRLKGQKVAAKRADRETTEGDVFVWSNDNDSESIAIALGCETEPVAVNDQFKTLGETILKAAVENKPATVEELIAIAVDGETLEAKITDLIGKIGEKIHVASYAHVTGEKVAAYKHGRKIAVLVELVNTDGADVVEAGRDVAMQVAAMNPVAVSEADVDPTVIAKEKEIGREKALQEGKPENIVDRIADGYVKKFLKENTLLEQSFVKDPSVSVAQYLNNTQKGMTVKAFHRVSTGA